MVDIKYVCNYTTKDGKQEKIEFDGCKYYVAKSCMDGTVYCIQETVTNPTAESSTDILYNALHMKNGCRDVRIGVLFNGVRTNIMAIDKVSSISLNSEISNESDEKELRFIKRVEIR